MYIFYHTLAIAMANAWFLYKRDCKILCLCCISSTKKPPRRRPSLGSIPKKRKVQVNQAPIDDIRFDGIAYFPYYEEKRQCCTVA
jgi:hypothetical protein